MKRSAPDPSAAANRKPLPAVECPPPVAVPVRAFVLRVRPRGARDPRRGPGHLAERPPLVALPPVRRLRVRPGPAARRGAIRDGADVSLDPLYRVIGWLLAFFYIPFHNIGIAIILLTVVIMLVQFPLTAKQARSMIQMQRVQPEIKKIQQKYKDDKTKQNEELLKFYQENKINPLAGCLPMIITIPIGIAVFRTFSKGVQHHLPTDRADGRALPRDLRDREDDHRVHRRTLEAGLPRRRAAGAALPRCDREPDRARCPDLRRPHRRDPLLRADRAWSRSPVGTRSVRPRRASCRAGTNRRTRRWPR